MIIEYLKKIINPNSNIEININPYNAPINGIITLEETDPSANLKQVNLIGFDPKHTYAFKLDVQGQRISQYLNPSEPKIHTACDGIIFTIIDEIFYVFFCEMKSSRPNIQECIVKYRNSTLFIKYIFSIIQDFYHVSSEFSFNEIEYKYILFDIKTNAHKTPTVGKRNKVIPELLSYDGERILVSNDKKKILLYQIHHLTPEDLFNIRHLNLN